MKETIEQNVCTLLDTEVNQPILSIATDYIISIALAFLHRESLPTGTISPISKAVYTEYLHMIDENENIKTYSAGDITLNFADRNLTAHLRELEKNLLPYRKVAW